MTAILEDRLIGGVRMILGDARDVLPGLRARPDFCPVDLVVTDPPYALSSGGNTPGAMGGKFHHEVYDNTGLMMETVAWSEIGGPLLRACAPRADAYVMCEDRNLPAALNGFMGAGWRYHGIITWDKHTPSRSRFYMKCAEHVIYLFKGNARDITNGGSKRLWREDRPKGAVHPTQKPLALMEHLITNSSRIGDLVLDPFMGSGTTLVAAVNTDRRGIGIELDPAHYAAACARVEAAVAARGECAGAVA